MFEVPNAKRVKRTEIIRDHDSSDASDAESRATSDIDVNTRELRVDYGFQYDFVTPPSTTQAIHQSTSTTGPDHDQALARPNPGLGEADDDANKSETTYQFRLFTSHPKPQPSSLNTKTAKGESSLKTHTLDHTIRLSPTPPPSTSALALADSIPLEQTTFLRPHRPDSYYFTSSLPPSTITSRKSQYANIAVSSTDILTMSKTTKWPGTALPWRVISVKLANPPPPPSLNPTTTHKGDQTSTRPKSTSDSRQLPHLARHAHARPRPSKKRRIVLRRRLAIKASEAVQAQAAEAAEREKRTRRNREKKVKRKEREKRKKNADAGLGASVGSMEEGNAAVFDGSE